MVVPAFRVRAAAIRRENPGSKQNTSSQVQVALPRSMRNDESADSDLRYR